MVVIFFRVIEFAKQKETGGYKSHFVMVDSLAVTALEKNAPGLGKFWYLPKGPNVTNASQLWKVLDKLKPFAQKNGAFAVRIEPELDRSLQPTLEGHGLQKSRPIIPNPSTILLDINPDLNTIMTNLPQKGRHAIQTSRSVTESKLN